MAGKHLTFSGTPKLNLFAQLEKNWEEFIIPSKYGQERHLLVQSLHHFDESQGIWCSEMRSTKSIVDQQLWQQRKRVFIRMVSLSFNNSSCSTTLWETHFSSVQLMFDTANYSHCTDCSPQALVSEAVEKPLMVEAHAYSHITETQQHAMTHA